ncbi:hypothetical protein [Actinomadura nitritigenes]|uniref:hypothetical protein n=1 Tax=Actinomadura nitritigenes TaxID=134602 RepID=UPI003D916D32
MDLTEIGLRLAAQKLYAERTQDTYERSRAVAEPLFAEARKKAGAKSLTVELPDGTEIASVAIKGRKVTYRTDDGALLAFVEQHQPNEIEEIIDPVEATRKEVLDLIREHRPDILRRRVRPVWYAARVKEAVENGGYLTDPDSGEKVQVAVVTVGDVTGEFAFTPKRAENAKLLAALQDPEFAEQAGIPELLSELGLPVAVPAAPAAVAEDAGDER